MSFLFEYMVPFVLVLSALVVAHELGHYWVARWNGVKVEAFSVGFGPELFGWTDRHQTRWKFSLIPLGGYVRMFGDADASSALPDKEKLGAAPEDLRSQSLFSKTPWQRIAVSAGGPLANYLFAFIIFIILFVVRGVPFYPPVVGKVLDESPAAKVGLQSGDTILRVNGLEIEDFTKLVLAIRTQPNQKLDLDVKRGADTLKFSLATELDEKTQMSKSVGIAMGQVEFRSQSPWSAVVQSAQAVYGYSVMMLQGIWHLIVGKVSSDNVGGVFTIGKFASDSVKGGWATVLFAMAILSINLGLINLFPVPVLDGGHILFAFIEGVRGKPVSEKAQEIAFLIGFIAVISLMVFSTWNDLVRFKVFSWLFGN